MSDVCAKKVFIQIESEAEQQEHLKTQRNPLKVLQTVSSDKENLTGRPQTDKLSRLKSAIEVSSLGSTENAKRKRLEAREAETQTSPEKNTTSANAITVEDLSGENNPSEFYWERLAEKRRGALEEICIENQKLHDRINGLEEELNTSRQMLQETRNLVDVLTEMLNENEAEREIQDAIEEPSKDSSCEDSSENEFFDDAMKEAVEENKQN